MKTSEIPDRKQVIGLSLSECIQDLLRGNVRFDQVIKIITGTHWRNEYEKGKIIGSYSETHWKNYPEGKGERYFIKLLEEGKIVQPRSEDGRFPDKSDGHWVFTEADIRWRTED